MARRKTSAFGKREIETNNCLNECIAGNVEMLFTSNDIHRASSGSVKISEEGKSYISREELLATKLRALYQRRKGRDLFDLWLGVMEGKADAGRITQIFKHYMENEGQTLNGMIYEKNLQEKMKHRGFLSDIDPLLPADTTYDIEMAFSRIRNDLLRKIDDTSK